MFGMLPSKWKLDVKFGVLEIICTAPLINIPFAYEQTLGKVLQKMAELISAAEKYDGKSLESMPMPKCPENTLVISTAIKFKTENDIAKFKTEVDKIFKQE